MRGRCCPTAWMRGCRFSMCIRTVACRSNAPMLAPWLGLLVSRRSRTHLSRLCPRPFPVPSQVGGLIAALARRLGWRAAAAACAYLGVSAVQTRLYSPSGSTLLPHDARVLTNLACAHDPTVVREREKVTCREVRASVSGRRRRLCHGLCLLYFNRIQVST